MLDIDSWLEDAYDSRYEADDDLDVDGLYWDDEELPDDL
jgi:hypothetical protein